MDSKKLAIMLVQAANDREHSGFTIQELCEGAIEMFMALENNDSRILSGQLELLEEDALNGDIDEEIIEELRKRLGK